MEKAVRGGNRSILLGIGINRKYITPHPNSNAEYSAKNNQAKLDLPYSVL
jgi:hypothetical protein